MDEQKVQTLNCSSCGAQLKIDDFQETVTCEYCDTSFSVAELLNESDELRIEKNKNRAYVEVEKGKREAESEYLRHKIEQEKVQQKNDEIARFKKSKLSKALIAWAVISALFCLISFGSGNSFKGFIAIAMVASAMFSWLTGAQIVKEKKNGMRILCAVLAFVLIIPYFIIPNKTSEKPKVEIVWSDLTLGHVLPEPSSTLGEVNYDTETTLWISLHEVDEEEYKNYITECQNFGFVIESNKTSTGYDAYNAEGYKLSLSKYSDELSVHLDAPEKMEDFVWPEYGLALMIPKPESTIGKIIYDNSDSFNVHIGNMSVETFNDYIEKCQNKGFTVNHNKSENYYNDEDGNGYEITLRYLGFNRVEIYIKSSYSLDYSDAESFEKALNNGEKVEGKIVKFELKDYKPDSAFGINLHAGEHLNFLSETECDVKQGDIVICQITEEPYKFLGSWMIDCDVLSIQKATETESTAESTTIPETTVKSTTTTIAETTKNNVTTTQKPTERATTVVTEKPRAVYYSTNDYETAKKGNTGVYSYKNTGGAYDIYWIIDFNEGYIYWFTDGNGETTCDKVKIYSGTLNDKVTVTWHDGGDQWSWYLHFKYVNNPSILVVNDHNGFATEFSTTDLESALKVRDTKTIIKY